MTSDYKEILLQSFLNEYSRVYLIDLENDTIEKVMEAGDVSYMDPVFTRTYSEFNHIYSNTRLDPEYSQWRMIQGSIENLRKNLAETNCFTLSYQMQDGKWKRVENRVAMKRDGMPVKVFACIRDGESSGAAGTDRSAPERFRGTTEVTADIRHTDPEGRTYQSTVVYNSMGTFEINVTRDEIT